MKKIMCFIIIFSSVILLNSCGLIYDGDSKLANTKFDTLLDYIEKNEVKKINDLFAPVIREEVGDLDNQIKDMCEFVKGEHQLVHNLGTGGSISYNYGKEVRTFDMCYTIENTSNTYSYLILWRIKDDYESKNIGIWSINLEEIIGEKPPTTLEGWTNGINIIYGESNNIEN